MHSFPLAAGTGLIYFGAPAGSKITLHPAPTSPVVYAGNNGFDPSFTEIPANTSASRAEAVIGGVEPGLFEIEVTQTSGVCHRVEGWPSDKYAATIEVQADTFSVFNWICQ